MLELKGSIDLCEIVDDSARKKRSYILAAIVAPISHLKSFTF